MDETLGVVSAAGDEDAPGEAWPPAEYNPKAPLTLPLGPKTANLRMMLAAEVRYMRSVLQLLIMMVLILSLFLLILTIVRV